MRPFIPQKALQRVALLGSYVPRQCGIATFTADIARALGHSGNGLKVDCVAMSDHRDYEYPPCVRHEIQEADYAAYEQAAGWINQGQYDILSIQHEYGIFGGEAGSYLLQLAREVKMPIVTTLHTVLQEPSPAQREVMDGLLQLSERVIVMSRRAIGFLCDVHGLCPSKIDLIPHGIPEIRPEDGIDFRRTLGIDGPMILTFGLLSPDKGIQYGIQAMPAILEQAPGAVYVVVGATHPNVRASAGETYRDSLKALAKELGVEKSVRFVDRFVSNQELVQYLSAMDVYLTPYLNPKQITSGTLAYSIGAGKAVVSTPYWYAEELLSEGRGVLVPFRDPAAISQAVLGIEGDAERRESMGARASEYGKQMLWPAVGAKYLDSFARARADSSARLQVLVQSPQAARAIVLPKPNLAHLENLSDDTGILQHALYSIPNRAEGYCVDDNARALLLTAYMADSIEERPGLPLLQSRYLSFVQSAFNPENGRFRNFMSYRREWLEEMGSEDSHGRTMWSLGAMVGRCAHPGRHCLARTMFHLGAPAMEQMRSPRTWAYGVLAANEILRTAPWDADARLLRDSMAQKIWREYGLSATSEWPWFEQTLAYANARIPQALILAGAESGHRPMLEVGLSSLQWLMKEQTGVGGVFVPIGANGFYPRGGPRALFDQQPIEAWASMSACLSAYQATWDSTWKRQAEMAFRWFMGDNMLLAPMYDPATGGCYDGLHEDRVNLNQGAESTLSFLCALAEMREAAETIPIAQRIDRHGKL